MEPRKSYWSLVEPIWEKISIYDGEETFLRQYENTNSTARILFAAHWCQSEVRNGGFHQFFSNSTGVLAPEAVEAFSVLGMPKISILVSKAMSWFGPEYPRDRETRDELLGEYENENSEEWDPFENLDNEFFELIKSENGGFKIAADNFANNE